MKIGPLPVLPRLSLSADTMQRCYPLREVT